MNSPPKESPPTYSFQGIKKISLVIDNENDEIEIKKKFESLIKEHFIEKFEFSLLYQKMFVVCFTITLKRNNYFIGQIKKQRILICQIETKINRFMKIHKKTTNLSNSQI